MPPPVNDSVPTFSATEYVQTQGTGNRVSRKAVILGSQNIVLGGKCIIHHGAVIRGDLRRRDLLAAEREPVEGGAAAAGQRKPATQQQQQQSVTVSVTCGRYCTLGEGCVVRPAYKVYKGHFSFYSVRMGDHVHIGAGSIVEAGVIGSHVDVGRNCVLGKLSILKDCIRILDNSVIPPGAVLSSGTVWAGSPAKCIGEVAESFAEQHEIRTKDYYARFRAGA